MLFFTIMTQTNLNFIKSNSLRFFKRKYTKDVFAKSEQDCYAPAEFLNIDWLRPLIPALRNKSCNEMKLKDFFMKTKNFKYEKLQYCIDYFNHMDKRGYVPPKNGKAPDPVFDHEPNVYYFNNTCDRKNKWHRLYSYRGRALSTEDDPYINSAKFDGRLVMRNNTYEYKRGTNKRGGFMIASGAPIGNLKEILQDPTYKKMCGNYTSVELKDGTPFDCFTHNEKINGSYYYDNTHLAFYTNLKKHNVTHVVNLRDLFYIRNQKPEDKDTKCKCVVKMEKYHPFSDETFTIKNPDHVTNSDFVVTGKENEKTRQKILNKHIFRNGTQTNKTAEEEFITVRDLYFKNKNDKDDNGFKINHIHYKGWPYSASPQPETVQGKALMKIIKFIKEKIENGENVLIHCNGGAGKTAEVLISVLMDGLDSNKKFDFFRFITDLRKHRPYFFEKSDKMHFIRKYIELASKR